MRLPFLSSSFKHWHWITAIVTAIAGATLFYSISLAQSSRRPVEICHPQHPESYAMFEQWCNEYLYWKTHL